MLIKDCIKGKKTGTLTFVEFHKKENTRKMFGIFKCDCGNEKCMRLDAVKNDTSCGCLKRNKSADRLRKRMNDPQNKEWVKSINRTHGMKGTTEYRIWSGIKQRTDGKLYGKSVSYFRKGINMSPIWRNSFEQFYKDMGPRPEGMSIDRIDNNGDYEPGNCRWATCTEQNNNTSRNVFLECNGHRRTIKQWSNYFGVNRQYFYNRRNLGYDFQTTLNYLLCAAE